MAEPTADMRLVQASLGTFIAAFPAMMLIHTMLFQGDRHLPGRPAADETEAITVSYPNPDGALSTRKVLSCMH